MKLRIYKNGIRQLWRIRDRQHAEKLLRHCRQLERYARWEIREETGRQAR